MRHKRGGCYAPFAGELGPRLTQCGLGRGLLPYQVVFSSIQPFGHNRHGLKTRSCVPFRVGAATPSNTTSPGPKCTSVPSGIWIHPAIWPRHNRHGPVIGWGLCPFSGVGAGSPSSTKSHEPRPTSIPSGMLTSSRLATMDIGRKLGKGLCPFRGGRAGSPSNTILPRLRPTSVPSGILIHTAV